MSRTAIFLNDTSGTSNPGCQGTVAGLLQVLNDNEIDVIGRHPVGYGYRRFSDCDAPQPAVRLTARINRRIRRHVPGLAGLVAEDRSASVANPLCQDRWLSAIDAMTARLRPIWSQADQLIINGEGTIHHDSIGARNLIGLCAVGKRLGMQVSIVNCSIYALSELLLAEIRESVDQIIVREPVSARYLAEQQIPYKLAADCLFATRQSPAPGNECPPNPFITAISTSNNVAIYTPGVLSGTSGIEPSHIQADIRAMITRGYDVLYVIVEAEDEALATAAAQAGATIIPLGMVSWMQMFQLLKNVSLVVSGRYHINIFAAICGVPFLPMMTNTAKMNGLLELLGCGDVEVRSAGCQVTRLNLDQPICPSTDQIDKLRARSLATYANQFRSTVVA